MGLIQYAIYDSPADFPGLFVVREWTIEGTDIIPGSAQAVATLERARELIPPGYTFLAPMPGDVEHLIETWI